MKVYVHCTYDGVRCTEHPYRTRNERVGGFHERVGVLFFSWIWGSVWGSPRRLQVPYVIPRPGVPRHILIKTLLLQNDGKYNLLSWIINFFQYCKLYIQSKKRENPWKSSKNSNWLFFQKTSIDFLPTSSFKVVRLQF